MPNMKRASKPMGGKGKSRDSFTAGKSSSKGQKVGSFTGGKRSGNPGSSHKPGY